MFVKKDDGITVERNGKMVQLSAEEIAASIKPRIKVDPEHHFEAGPAAERIRLQAEGRSRAAARAGKVSVHIGRKVSRNRPQNRVRISLQIKMTSGKFTLHEPAAG